MRTGFKAPLIALSALALLSGCKSSMAKASYLRVDAGNAVQFIQLTQEGAQIKGTIDMVERTPDNEIITTLAVCDGRADGGVVLAGGRRIEAHDGFSDPKRNNY